MGRATWFSWLFTVGVLVTVVELVFERSQLSCKINGSADAAHETTTVLVSVSPIESCGTGVGEAFTLKTVSKQNWPLVEMLTLMSGNKFEVVTSPLSKCSTSPPSIWR